MKCRTVPRYPATADREFQRLTSAYLKLLHEELKKELPALIRAYRREQRGDSRMDDIGNFRRLTEDACRRIMQRMEQKTEDFDLWDRAAGIARMTRNTSLREWKRAVHDTLGIDLLDDYYSGSFYEEYLRKWVDQNVLKIKSIPSNTLDEMREIILNGYKEGRAVGDIQREIQEKYNTSKHHARMLARDQVGTLNSQLAQAQQRDAGVRRYRWSTSHDSRVRDCHAELDGKEFSWDDPPEMWYETKSRGTVYTGRRCHAGEDYCCRCVAIPIFDNASLSIPMTS